MIRPIDDEQIERINFAGNDMLKLYNQLVDAVFEATSKPTYDLAEDDNIDEDGDDSDDGDGGGDAELRSGQDKSDAGHKKDRSDQDKIRVLQQGNKRLRERKKRDKEEIERLMKKQVKDAETIDALTEQMKTLTAQRAEDVETIDTLTGQINTLTSQRAEDADKFEAERTKLRLYNAMKMRQWDFFVNFWHPNGLPRVPEGAGVDAMGLPTLVIPQATPHKFESPSMKEETVYDNTHQPPIPNAEDTTDADVEMTDRKDETMTEQSSPTPRVLRDKRNAVPSVVQPRPVTLPPRFGPYVTREENDSDGEVPMSAKKDVGVRAKAEEELRHRLRSKLRRKARKADAPSVKRTRDEAKKSRLPVQGKSKVVRKPSERPRRTVKPPRRYGEDL